MDDELFSETRPCRVQFLSTQVSCLMKKGVFFFICILTVEYRKRRCDGGKPICGNCANSNADCVYDRTRTER